MKKDLFLCSKSALQHCRQSQGEGEAHSLRQKKHYGRKRSGTNANKSLLDPDLWRTTVPDKRSAHECCKTASSGKSSACSI